MNQLHVAPPARLCATVCLPASKSISNRALIVNALSGSVCPPRNVSDCDDTRVMVRALQEMPEVIDIMAAGTAMRFLSAYLSVTPGTHVITGTERMRHRPIAILVDALRQLGARVTYDGEEGFPPLRISGGAHQGGELRLPGNVSSQYISALLMIAPVLQQGLLLQLTGEVVSRPYIDMTLRIMSDFGAHAQWVDERTIKVEPKPYQTTPYTIENDWSAASYWYEMVALSADEHAEVLLPGLFSESTQGDSRISEFFRPLGVITEFATDGVHLRKEGTPVNRLELDLVNQPDLAQTLVVTCAMMGCAFRFTGLQSLKIKETDRIKALRTELRKLGIDVQEENDSVLYWNGETCTPEAQPAIDTYEDHRMAMAFAPCALVRGAVTINHPQVVSKSYPTYWESLQKAGFGVQEQ